MNTSINTLAAAIGSVTVSRSRTVNLGNYEKEDIFVSTTVPVYGDYQAAYNEAMAFVEAQLESEVEKVTGKSINSVTKKRKALETKAAEKATATTTEAEAEEVEEEVEEEVNNAPKVKTADVRAALKKVKDELSNETYKGILSEFGVKAFSALDESKYAEVIAACEKAHRIAEAEEEGTLDGDTDDLDGEEEIESSITLADFKAALKEYNAENGAGSHKQVLADAGYAGINDVPASKYADIIADLV